MARSKQLSLGSVALGDRFTFRTADVLGHDYCGKQPPYEGQVLKVVGFRPRLKNNVIVMESNGRYSLMPLWMVEKALR